MENTVLTYTRNDLEYINSKGCDDSWVLNQKRAGSCQYLVCCHSQGAKQRSAFLVGLISKVDLVGGNRWAIHISEYATVDVPNVWGGWQNPVRYTSLEDLEIDVSALKFHKIKPVANRTTSLTIEQAKEGLAENFGVSPDQIEIVIKG
jgi:hypothetical protein